MVRKTARVEAWISHVHVIGAGTMGGDIAACGRNVRLSGTLSDLDAAAITKAVGRAGKLFERRLKTSDKIKAAIARLTADLAGNGVSEADIIIEVVAERLEVKQAVFRLLKRLRGRGHLGHQHLHLL